MPTNNWRRWCGLAAVLGGSLGLIIGWLTPDNWDKPVLGMHEGQWSRIKNLPLLLCMVGLVGFGRQIRQPGALWKFAFGISLLGLFLILLGNLLEYGLVGGYPGPSWPPEDVYFGWGFVLLGLGIVLPLGLILLGVAALRGPASPAWSRFVPLIAGVGSLLGTVIALVQQTVTGRGEVGFQVTTWSLGFGLVAMGCALWSQHGTAIAPAAVGKRP